MSYFVFNVICVNVVMSWSNAAAEKVMSLGRNWHRPCLRCVRCKKTLTPGGHAEVLINALFSLLLLLKDFNFLKFILFHIKFIFKIKIVANAGM